MVKAIQGDRVCKEGRLAVGCSAAVLDPTGEKMLLIRRTDSGNWAVPGGYMEPGETFTETCAREVLEETGLHVRVGRLVAVYTSPHVLLHYEDGNRLQIIAFLFAAEVIGGEMTTSEESSEVGFFTREEMEGMQMVGLNRQRVSDGFAGQAAAFVREDFSLL